MKRFFCLVLLACVLLCGCSGSSAPVRETVFCMDTVMDLQVWGRDAEEGLRKITEELNALERDWSATSGSSLLAQMNRGEAPALLPWQAMDLPLNSPGTAHVLYRLGVCPAAVDVGEVKNAFMASGDNLFHFVMNYSGYRIKMDEEAKLVLFCQIATQYLEELHVGDEYRQQGEIEYPMIYPLTSSN